MMNVSSLWLCTAIISLVREILHQDEEQHLSSPLHLFDTQRKEREDKVPALDRHETG